MPAQIRDFLKSLLQVGLLTVAIILLVFFGIRPDPQHYFFGSLAQAELIKNTPGPRIIVFGGSNVALGVDAQLIQESLGVAAINDGLHGGLGVVPMRELMEYMRPGDVIIVSLEYSTFAEKGSLRGDPAFLSDWIEFEPRRISHLFDPWAEAPGIYLTMLQRKANRQLNILLHTGSREEMRAFFEGQSFDANGDFIGHLGKEPTSKITNMRYPVAAFDEEAFAFLAEFQRFARGMGAQVYFEAPASRQTNCILTGMEQMKSFFEIFAQKTGIPVLTPLDDVCLPDQYFFDTPYHLNEQGRKIRTKRLIENLIGLNIIPHKASFTGDERR